MRDLAGGTAYVTLEPCNHTGRTPPCTEALIAAGLGRVVAATIDPNPAVAGHGMEPCAPPASKPPSALAKRSPPSQRRLCPLEPAPPPARADEGRHDARRAHRPAARLSNSRTRPTGSPAKPPAPPSSPCAGRPTPPWSASTPFSPTTRMLTDRSGLRRRRPLLRLVLDSALRMPLDSKLVATAHNDVVVFTVSNDEARIRELRPRGVRVEVLPAEAGRVPLGKVLDKLGEEGILTLLTETGTRLNTALLAGGLVDRIHLFVSPQIMGSDAVPAFRGMSNPIHMAEVEVERYGNDLGLCSLLNDPWPPA